MDIWTCLTLSQHSLFMATFPVTLPILASIPIWHSTELAFKAIVMIQLSFLLPGSPPLLHSHRSDLLWPCRTLWEKGFRKPHNVGQRTGWSERSSLCLSTAPMLPTWLSHLSHCLVCKEKLYPESCKSSIRLADKNALNLPGILNTYGWTNQFLSLNFFMPVTVQAGG